MILSRGQTFDAQNVTSELIFTITTLAEFLAGIAMIALAAHFPPWEMRLSESRTKDLWAPIHANLGSKLGFCTSSISTTS